MAGAGRTPKLMTDAVRKAVLKATRAGCPLVHAARAAGIGATTLRQWRRRGKAGEQPYADFLADMKRAESDGVATLTARVFKASARQWQAAAWYLERRYPDLFALDRKELVQLRKEFAELAARLEELKRASDRPPPSDEPPPPPAGGGGAGGDGPAA